MFDHARMGPLADRTIAALQRNLVEETEAALHRGMPFPPDWDPYFRCCDGQDGPRATGVVDDARGRPSSGPRRGCHRRSSADTDVSDAEWTDGESPPAAT